MNIEEYIKSITNKFYLNMPKDPNGLYTAEFGALEDIILLDCNKEYFTYKDYNDSILSLKPNGALFIIGGLPLVYQLVKNRIPILIAEEDVNVSVVLPNEESCLIDINKIPKMLPHHYWDYINLWNTQGNRNIIAQSKLLRHILWNRFNPDNIKFYD